LFHPPKITSILQNSNIIAIFQLLFQHQIIIIFINHD